MKNNKTLKVGVINLILTLFFLVLLILFNKTENTILLIVALIIILYGFFLSIKGIVLSLKGLKNKTLTTSLFFLSIFLNCFFPIIIGLLLLFNLKDLLLFI